MDIYPKFIIETDDELGDCLVIAKCTYHHEIVINKEKVKGGGWWTLKDNKFILRGSSQDFGTAKIEDIKSCIENGNVYTDPYAVNSITNKYKFAYDTGSEIIDFKKNEDND